MATLKQLLCSILLLTIFNLHSQNNDKKEIFVIVHGAYGGSHNFKEVDSILKVRNKTVYRPCLTGLGEKVHLSSPNIGLQTHTLDVINKILYEDIRDVILVGHSYSGMVITGVADSIPKRIKKLIYLDAIVPFSGETALSIQGTQDKKWFNKPVNNGLMYLKSKKLNKYPPKNEGHPYKTLIDTIYFDNKRTKKIPTSFIDCGADFFAKRAKTKGWPVYKLGNKHNVQWSDPTGLVDLLIKIADE